MRALAAPAGALAAGAAALGWVGAVDPGVPGRYPVCPLFHTTGLLCPGCGGLRSAHAIAQGDPAAAFGANALVVLAVAAAAVVWVLWAVRAVRAVRVGPAARQGRAARPAPAGCGARFVRSRPVWWAAGVLVTAFTVVRNLSFGAGLAP
ncbi:DUF2752 domain-containing protein [Streptomyces xinghaiensis]|uniref:DUF2752 domain-containing protein n=1 Tax=Streptomyces xinghaiensis TaxID=1038928 RepID=UPI002E10BECF|nr:DUF2752 domain-containing protein [Streptomyces xinghaiensis]